MEYYFFALCSGMITPARVPSMAVQSAAAVEYADCISTGKGKDCDVIILKVNKNNISVKFTTSVNFQDFQ